MAKRAETLTIDLDSLTEQDVIDVRAIAVQGGVDLAAVDLADPPIPVLAGLVYVAMRRTAPRITALRCTKIALATWEAAHGG